jgi:ribosomal protein S18 acetylase RimI-like enzyme
MTELINPNRIEITQEADTAIEIMHNVGVWLVESNLHPEEYWLPENMNREYLLKHVNPEEFYVISIDSKPAASVVLQEDQRNQSWEPVDGVNTRDALYIHWLAVNREFAGKGLPQIVLDLAITEAKTRGYNLIRLDTIASNPKLRKVYDDLGFTAVHIGEGEFEDTVFYQMEI